MIWVWQIKPPSSPEGRFTQILSVGIGGSALGPQFVAEALAPDNPPLKVIQSNPSQPNIDVFVNGMLNCLSAVSATHSMNGK